MNTRKTIIVIALAVIVLASGIYVFSGGERVSTDKTATTTSTSSPQKTAEPQIAVIGQSAEGRDIEAYSFGNGETHVVFVGAIHGGYEWNTVLLSRQLIDLFTNEPEHIPEGVQVTIIPMLNPDGVHKVIGTTGEFTSADAPSVEQTTKGRFNANGVDLNRNFACNWQSTSTWRGETVDAGKSAFSEPEAQVMRDYTMKHEPDAAIFFHSAANGVYGSSCNDGILPATREIMNTYADASGYPAIESFDHYEITGDVEGWHAKLGIPSVSVELTSHGTLEGERNRAGVVAVLEYFAEQ